MNGAEVFTVVTEETGMAVKLMRWLMNVLVGRCRSMTGSPLVGTSEAFAFPHMLLMLALRWATRAAVVLAGVFFSRARLGRAEQLRRNFVVFSEMLTACHKSTDNSYLKVEDQKAFLKDPIMGVICVREH